MLQPEPTLQTLGQNVAFPKGQWIDRGQNHLSQAHQCSREQSEYDVRARGRCGRLRCEDEFLNTDITLRLCLH